MMITDTCHLQVSGAILPAMHPTDTVGCVEVSHDNRSSPISPNLQMGSSLGIEGVRVDSAGRTGE